MKNTHWDWHLVHVRTYSLTYYSSYRFNVISWNQC